MTDSNTTFIQPLGRMPFIILMHCLVFALIAWLFLPNMDRDMYENYAWGQTLEWGSFKHPPFFVWITRFWFSVFPSTNFCYFLLSYFNAGVGLWGVLCLAKLLIANVPAQRHHLLQQHNFLFLVLGFSILSLPFNLYASVFNADSISLSLWPWTTYAFFSSLYANRQIKKWLWTLLLSILSAAAMMGKYFSAVLLLTLFIISISDRRYRCWYATFFPYVSLILFVLLLAPHALWEYRMGFPFTSYYSHYLHGNHILLLKYLFIFVLTGFYFFSLSWLSWCVLKRCPTNFSMHNSIKSIDKRLLFYLCFLPVLITVVLSLLGEVNVKDRWAIPVWFALPIFMANLLIDKLNAIGFRLNIFKKIWVTFILLIGITFSYILTGSYSYFSDHHDYLEARKEMAVRMSKRFEKAYPNQVLSWVGGDTWPDHTAALAFYLENHPHAVPGYPNQMPALVNPHPTWNQEYGVIVCGKRLADNVEVVQACVKQTRSWLASIGSPINEEVMSYRARGWRWSLSKLPKQYITVFWLRPQHVQ